MGRLASYKQGRPNRLQVQDFVQVGRSSDECGILETRRKRWRRALMLRSPEPRLKKAGAHLNDAQTKREMVCERVKVEGEGVARWRGCAALVFFWRRVGGCKGVAIGDGQWSTSRKRTGPFVLERESLSFVD